MFRNTFVKEFLTILNSDGPNPLKLWKPQNKNGYVKRIWDTNLQCFAIEIRSSNVSTCLIETKGELGISLPFICLQIKNLKHYFTFQIMIRDDSGIRRRIRFSNFDKKTLAGTFSASVPLCLNYGYDYLRIDLDSITRRAFNATYVETVGVQINANCRVRRVFFCQSWLPSDELPKELSLKPRVCTKTQRREKKKLAVFSESTAAPPPTPSGDAEEDVDSEGRTNSLEEDENESNIDELLMLVLNPSADE